MYFTIGPLFIGWRASAPGTYGYFNNGYYKHIAGRFWWRERSHWERTYTRKYLTWRLGQLLAHIAVAEEGAIAACEAMTLLNRAAKHADEAQRDEIYRIKRRFIGELLEQFPCAIARHVQELLCHSCEGGYVRGRGGRSWRCNRCDNGVYRRHELLLFTFTVGDRNYRWHQPLSHWPRLAVDGEPEPYDAAQCSCRRVDVEPGLRYETLIETVATWIDRQGMPLGISARPTSWKFSTAVADDVRVWRRARAAHRERRRSRMTVSLARPTLPRIPARGCANALADMDLPF